MNPCNFMDDEEIGLFDEEGIDHNSSFKTPTSPVEEMAPTNFFSSPQKGKMCPPTPQKTSSMIFSRIRGSGLNKTMPIQSTQYGRGLHTDEKPRVFKSGDHKSLQTDLFNAQLEKPIKKKKRKRKNLRKPNKGMTQNYIGGDDLFMGDKNPSKKNILSPIKKRRSDYTIQEDSEQSFRNIAKNFLDDEDTFEDEMLDNIDLTDDLILSEMGERENDEMTENTIQKKENRSDYQRNQRQEQSDFSFDDYNQFPNNYHYPNDFPNEFQNQKKFQNQNNDFPEQFIPPRNQRELNELRNMIHRRGNMGMARVLRRETPKLFRSPNYSFFKEEELIYYDKNNNMDDIKNSNSFTQSQQRIVKEDTDVDMDSPNNNNNNNNGNENSNNSPFNLSNFSGKNNDDSNDGRRISMPFTIQYKRRGKALDNPFSPDKKFVKQRSRELKRLLQEEGIIMGGGTGKTKNGDKSKDENMVMFNVNNSHNDGNDSNHTFMVNRELYDIKDDDDNPMKEVDEEFEKNRFGNTKSHFSKRMSEPVPKSVSYKNTGNDDPLRRTSFPVTKSQTSRIVPTFSRYFNDFKEISVLGIGSYGKVAKCKSTFDGKYYAIKQMNRMIKGERHETNVLREVHAHATLVDNPYVVRYYNCWIEDNRLFLQTEYCEGLSLLAKFSKKIKFYENELLVMVKQVASGLNLMHAQNLVHLDIKPENIFCKRNGIYKIGDLGLVASSLEFDRDILEGDCRYLPSELINQNENVIVDLKKADVFSLGATVLELAIGMTLPKNGDNWTKLRNGNIPPMKGFSNHFKTLVHVMLHPSPTKRPTSAQVLHHPALKSIIPHPDDILARNMKLEDVFRYTMDVHVNLRQEICLLKKEIERLNETEGSIYSGSL